MDGPIVHCHCATCRKAHAAAYATTVRVMREHFHWTAGADGLTSHESSPGKFRQFCRRCGSHLVAERPTQPHVILRAATLDDDPGQQPAMRIWTSHDVDWLTEEVEVPCYEEWQPER